MTALDTAKRLCIEAGFEPEDEGVYTSREGGNGTDCVPSPETIKRARAVVAQIRALGLNAQIDTCDEWVSIIVSLNS